MDTVMEMEPSLFCAAAPQKIKHFRIIWYYLQIKLIPQLDILLEWTYVSLLGRNYVKNTNLDTIIFRIFKQNPLVFWHWRDYISNDHKYQFPYKDWNEIKKRRPSNYVLNKRWQMF